MSCVPINIFLYFHLIYFCRIYSKITHMRKDTDTYAHARRMSHEEMKIKLRYDLQVKIKINLCVECRISGTLFFRVGDQ